MGITAERAPLATYRVQLGPHLSLEQLTGLLIYFRDLGISHLYLSPCLRAAAGSPHGYDMVDPTEVNPELGGLEGFERLCAAAAALGMGLVGGLTAAPCTGPILAGILPFVATTHNELLGFTLLFTYAVGIGVLFWLLATFAVALPKSGAWMDAVKSAGGTALLVFQLG